jgi:hypothetical protein
VKLAAVLLTLVLTLFACSHAPLRIADGRTCQASCEHTISYRIGYGFSETQADAIRDSFAIVKRASGGRECSAEGGEDLLFIHAPDQDFIRPWVRGDGWKRYVGLYRQGVIFLVIDEFTIADARQIIVHEILHSIGLDHVTSEASIMHPNCGQLVNGELSEYDAAKLAEVRHYTCP